MKMGKMNMGNMMKGFNMRQLGEDEVGMGLDGRTYFKRKDGDYVRYDFEIGQIVNTHDMKFDFGMAMIIPSPTVEVRDMIVKGDSFLCITKVTKNKIFGVSLNSGRTESIVKEVSAFGFNFYQKVVNMMDGQNGMSNMFGNMNPMMLMMMNGDSEGGSDMMQNMMMMQMFGGMGNINSQAMSNPFQNMFGNVQQGVPSNNLEIADGDEDLTPDEIEAEIERLQALRK
jgi:hypothetical protein